MQLIYCESVIYDYLLGFMAYISSISLHFACIYLAIHHMAMVKVIAMHSLGFEEEDFPGKLGRAPSTVKHDHASE